MHTVSVRQCVCVCQCACADTCCSGSEQRQRYDSIMWDNNDDLYVLWFCTICSRCVFLFSPLRLLRSLIHHLHPDSAAQWIPWEGVFGDLSGGNSGKKATTTTSVLKGEQQENEGLSFFCLFVWFLTQQLRSCECNIHLPLVVLAASSKQRANCVTLCFLTAVSTLGGAASEKIKKKKNQTVYTAAVSIG